MAQLERAVELDPQFTAAWVTLVDVYGAAQLNLPAQSAEWLQKQGRALNRAQELAPNSASVKLVLAGRELTKANLIEAERLLAAVKDLPPSLSVQGYMTYAVFLMAIGRTRDAEDPLMRVLQTEPLAVVPSLQLQVLYEVLGEYDRADVEYERSLGFANDTSILRGTAVTRAMARRDGALLRKALAQLSPTDVFGGPINTPMSRLLGDPKAALVELRRIYGASGFVPDSFRLAVVAQWAAYLGDPELSLHALRRMPRAGVGAPSLSAMFTLWRPVERDTRRLPAFKDLVRELGLVDYWRSTGNWGEFCRPVGANDFECK
jgi:tetratricopeptide (TPR) repeat protein